MKKLTEEQTQELKRKAKMIGGTVMAGGSLYLAYKAGAIAGIGEALHHIVKNGEVELTEIRSGKKHLFTATEVVKDIVK